MLPELAAVPNIVPKRSMQHLPVVLVVRCLQLLRFSAQAAKICSHALTGKLLVGIRNDRVTAVSGFFLWPVMAIACERGMPARSMFLTAERRKSRPDTLNAAEEYGRSRRPKLISVCLGSCQTRTHIAIERKRAGLFRLRDARGNPWLRLLRQEVEALVKERHGGNYLRERQVKTELAG